MPRARRLPAIYSTGTTELVHACYYLTGTGPGQTAPPAIASAALLNVYTLLYDPENTYNSTHRLCSLIATFKQKLTITIEVSTQLNTAFAFSNAKSLSNRHRHLLKLKMHRQVMSQILLPNSSFKLRSISVYGGEYFLYCQFE